MTPKQLRVLLVIGAVLVGSIALATSWRFTSTGDTSPASRDMFPKVLNE